MLNLRIRRPRQVTLGRTQSYRMQIIAQPGGAVPAEIFVCSKEACGVLQFERVADLSDIAGIPVDPSKPLWRTASLDLYVASEPLADEMLDAMIGDIKALLDEGSIPTGVQDLSGASI